MLCGYFDYLNGKKIVLGSQSINRKKLLDDAGLKVVQIISGFEEDLVKDTFDTVTEYVRATCTRKREALLKQGIDFDLLIVCDTVCAIGKKVIEKATDKQDHIRMMKELRDAKTHQVVSVAYLVFSKDGQNITKEIVSITDVEIAQIPDASIEKYLDCYPHCINVSGGYEMLQSGMTVVSSITGSPANLYGLPISEITLGIVEAIESNQL